MADLTVATNDRGSLVLAQQPGLRPMEMGDSRARACWLRYPDVPDDLVQAIDSMPRLAWLHTDTAGIDHLPVDLLRQRKITVTKTSAYKLAVAEWALTAVLTAAKGLPEYVRASDAASWAPDVGRPRLVFGTRAVIVGRGEIGSLAAELLRRVGVITSAAGRTGESWRELVSEADWLILACPLTRETTGMVGLAELARLAAGGWLINLGRGDLLSPGILGVALDNGRLAGAVLDSDDGRRYLGHHQILVLPHDTWRARGAGQRQVQDFLAQARRYKSGQPLLRVADLAAGY